MPVQLPVSFIEHIHDVLIGVYLPFDEKVNPSEHRDVARIESALGRPYHGSFGEEFYPHLCQKAAALFHSLVCNHCFINGNKRTAVIALDMFLMVNRHILVMPPEDVYDMAKSTANANFDGVPTDALMERLSAQIFGSMVDVDLLHNDPDIKEKLGEHYQPISDHVTRTIQFGVKCTESFLGKKLPTSED